MQWFRFVSNWLITLLGKINDAEKYLERAVTEAAKTNDEQLKNHIASLHLVFPKEEKK